jgi:2-oxoglutarate dehydrogenase E2 component (dihydrolipoamide succinyltransferase)
MEKLIDITMPALQEGTESTIAAWLKRPGDSVTLHEPIVEINTDKASMEISAPATGVLLSILKEAEQKIQPGEVLGRIQVTSDVRTPAAKHTTAEAQAPPAPPPSTLSPAVRSLVQQHQVDLTRITGTGRGGRITHEDVLNYLKSSQPQSVDEPLKGTMVRHTPMRRRIAHHMVQSILKTAPHVTAVFDADMSAVIAHREHNRPVFEQQGVKLTYTAYFVAAAVKALQAVPEVNSRWHEDALEVFSDCNVGIATAVRGGLVVPVIKMAQSLDLLGIARRLQELTEKARQGKLDVAELQNGSFTITNHGVSGSLIATPAINQPQSAILGIGKLEKRVVVLNAKGTDSIQVKPMLYVTLTIDHRALDGFQANSFLTKFVEALRQW